MEDGIPALKNWEVYRDALAPNQDKPLPKPWERAPVSAHAARLQGHKIWKRSGIRNNNNKENDLAQSELEKGGFGARKRARITGAKENINDAPWARDSKRVVEEESIVNSDNMEDPAEKEAQQFVPRKRTNTDHVITPKKPWKQPILNGQAETLGSDDTNDCNINSTKKPVRKRKSLRHSMVATMSQAITHLNSIEKIPSLAVSDLLSLEESEPPHMEATKSASQSSLRQSDLQSLQSFKLGLEVTVKVATKEDIKDVTQVVEKDRSPPKEDFGRGQTIDCTFSESTTIPLNDNEVQGEKSLLLPTLADSPTVQGRSSDLNTNDLPSEAADVESKILPSIEMEGSATSQISVTGTSKKRKSTTFRRGTRRSTRTRSSSIKSDIVPVEEPISPAEMEASTGNSKLHEDSPQITIQSENLFHKSNIDSEIILQEEEATVTKVGRPEQIAESHIAPDSAHFQAPDDEPKPMSFDLDDDTSSQCNVQSIEKDSDSLDDVNISNEDLASIAGIIQHRAPEPRQEYGTPSKEHPVLLASLILLDDEPQSPSDDTASDLSSLLSDREGSPTMSDGQTVEILESFEPVFVPADQTLSFKMPSNASQDPQDTTTPDPTTSDLVETTSENAAVATYNHDDTDMLRNFLTRVKANKAAKAEAAPKRKRSLPHSPLQLPLEDADTTMSLTQFKDEFDVSLPETSPSKRRKRNGLEEMEDEVAEPKSTRRSGRTRLPVIKSAVAAPSFIPVRRLGQDADATVTLKRSEDKELAALTRVNTRKNKGSAVLPAKLLRKKVEEKDDPALRQRLLKEVFNSKQARSLKGKPLKTVAWAVEIVQFSDGDKVVDGAEKDLKETEKSKPTDVKKSEEKKAVRVGVRSKIALGMAANGTPAAKR